jgi:hypothetical protein
MLGASLRRDVAPYPHRWRSGWLTIGIGPPTWWPHFGFARRPVVLPAPVAVAEIRHVSGRRERFIVNTDCRIIVVRDDDVSFELAVPATDLAAATDALAGRI